MSLCRGQSQLPNACAPWSSGVAWISVCETSILFGMQDMATGAQTSCGSGPNALFPLL